MEVSIINFTVCQFFLFCQLRCYKCDDEVDVEISPVLGQCLGILKKALDIKTAKQGMACSQNCLKLIRIFSTKNVRMESAIILNVSTLGKLENWLTTVVVKLISGCVRIACSH
jgi:hypothetical protein